MTTRSTSASAASALRSGVSPAKRAAVALERTIERADARQRRRDRVRQAERQEVRLGIGTQHAERQHDEARERAGQRRRVVAVDAANGAQLLGHRVGRRRPFRRPLGQRAADHAIHRRHGRASRSAPAAARAASRAGPRRPCGRRTPGGPRASRTGWRRPRTDRCARRRRSPVTCSGAM